MNIITYNVRGLQQKNKRIKIYNFLKDNIKLGCVLMQETHSASGDENKWASEWKGKIYQNHGSSNARGVAIGFSDNWDFEEKKYIHDNDGRLQLLSFKYKDKLYMLINIYNNNIESEQVVTLKKLDSLLGNFENLSEHIFIIGGDWNFVQDLNLDTVGGNPSLKLHSIAEFIKIKSKFDLCDIFRVRNPTKKRFTYFQRNPILARRLDFFLVSNSAQETIDKCVMLPSLSSDHSPVKLSLKVTTNNFKRGRNYWKFNNSLLGNELFCNGLKREIETQKNSIANIDPQMKWELLKFEIRRFSRKFSKNLANEKRENQTKWEEIVKNYETCPNDEHNLTEIDYLTAKASLENLLNHRTAGFILRSKTKWFEEGEKSSKFFLNLEKKKSIQNTIQVVIENDVTLTDETEISNNIKSFYKRLFEKKNVAECSSFLSGLNLTTLNEDQREICELPFSEEDLKTTLDSMENDKSPGNDGLTKEFYSEFWPTIGCNVYESFVGAFSNQELSTSQRQAIIKLLEKKDRDRRYIKNWRPISLLNIDVKLLNKTLASKLKQVLPAIIHSDQTAYVSGRFIGESTRLISDILETTKILNIEGYILTMDIEKAFDSMDHSFLMETLKAFGFGENFMKWISIILKNQESCVMNGGISTGYFKLLRGARQGDPISAYLFVMVLEIFFIMIRSNAHIKGLTLCNFEYKLTAFADDTTFFCSDLDSIKLIIDRFKSFSRYSGLVANTDKCEICGIGVKKGVNIALCGLKCVNLTNDSIKILGVHFSYNVEISKSKNFMNIIESIQNVIAVWRMRSLTLSGKITILKTLVMSKVVFISFLSSVPKVIIEKLIDVQKDFLWDGKRPKIKHAALLSSYELGGLKSLDIESKIKALQLSWIKRLYDDSMHSWKNIPLHYLNMHGTDIFYPNLEITPNNNMPAFYKNIIQFWMEIAKCNPVTINSIITQKLCFNHFIKVGDIPLVKTFENINLVNDLIDEHGLMSWQNLKTKHGLEDRDQFRWRQIIGAIPSDWKIIIARDISVATFYPGQYFLHLTRMRMVEKLTCKEIYNFMIFKLKEAPTSEIKIQEILNTSEILWKEVYTIARKVTVDNYSRQFHFKLCHNILYVNKILHRMHLVESSTCSFCHTEEETIVHLFSQCSVTTNLWSEIRTFFSSLIALPELTPQSAFLGFYNVEEHKIITNQILLTFKMVIYKSRDSGACNFNKFLNKIKQIKLIEDTISRKHHAKLAYNERKWSVIRTIFNE